jgi:hypothetical protein
MSLFHCSNVITVQALQSMSSKLSKYFVILLTSLFFIGCGGGGGGSSSGEDGGNGGGSPTETFSVYFYDENLTLLDKFSDLELNSLVDLDGNKSVHDVSYWYLGDDDTPITDANYAITNNTRFYTIPNVVEIANQTELAAINDDAGELNGRYILIDNIKLDGIGDGFETDTGWKPIGNGYSSSFKGIFSGSGHNISGLWINATNNDNVGLFGYISSAQIKDLGVEIADGKEIKGASTVGGIAGYMRNSSIANSYVIGNLSGTGFVGGIAGYVHISSSIANSYTMGNVSGKNRIGGIAGEIGNSSIITNSYAEANVRGIVFIGGIAGDIGNSSITNSYATGSVSGIGGVVGGIAGYVNGGGSIIKNNAAINPFVEGITNVNRIVGYIEDAPMIENNFASNTPITPDGSKGNSGTLKDITEFTEETTYSSAIDGDGNGGLGWAFGDNDSAPWQIHEGSSYPYLYWQKQEEQ